MKKLAKLSLFALIVFILIAAGVFAYVSGRTHYRTLVTVGDRQAIIIKNVRVFSGTSTTALENQQVLIEDGRIKKVEANTDTEWPNTKIIDGRGQTLLPGFIDFHVHLMNNAAPLWYLTPPNPAHQLESYLYAGVTTVVSMGDEITAVAELSRKVEAGEFPGPRVKYAGMSITKRNGHPQAIFDALLPWPLNKLVPSVHYGMDSAADAEAAVETMTAHGAHLIKLVVDDLPPGVPKLDAEEVKAIVQAARKKGRKVVAHIGKAEDALLAVENGVDALNHGIHRGTITDEQAHTLAKAGIALAPTLIVFERVAQMTEAKVRFGGLHREIEPSNVLEQFSDENIKAKARPDFLTPWSREVHQDRGEQTKNARTMHKAGSTILVGTDSAIPGNIAGASFHDEMQLLSQSGIPNADILLGATAKPAEFLFDKPELGTIEAGKIADLVLVDGNPLDDISVTKKIVTLIQDGRIVKRHRP